MYFADLDTVVDRKDDSFGATAEALRAEFVELGETNIQFVVLTANGPAGGNPLVRYYGHGIDELADFIRGFFDDDTWDNAVVHKI